MRGQQVRPVKVKEVNQKTFDMGPIVILISHYHD